MCRNAVLDRESKLYRASTLRRRGREMNESDVGCENVGFVRRVVSEIGIRSHAREASDFNRSEERFKIRSLMTTCQSPISTWIAVGSA